MSTRAERQYQLMSLYGSLPGGQTEKERRLYGFIPGEWLPNWVKQGYNQSIEGMARQVMNGEQVFKTDEDYDPNMVEDIAATVMSFATPTDFATLVLGGGIGGVAVKGIAVKQLTKEFGKRGLVEHFAKRKLATSGLTTTAAARAVNISGSKILNQARAKAVTGATGLGFYSGLQSALGQKITHDDIDVVTTLKDAAKGATLGALTGGIGGKVQQAVAKKGLRKYQAIGVEKGVETGVFGTVSPILEGELPSAESYIHAAGVIGGLSLKRAIVKKTIDVPKTYIKDSIRQKKFRESAEFEADVQAVRERGKEVWSDGKKNVRILTDYTIKERGTQKFVLKNLGSKKTFNMPKQEFFKQYRRTKDRFGENIDSKIQDRIFGLKDKLGLSDIEFKERVDTVLGMEQPLPLRKRKGKKGYHSNYNELKNREQKYSLLMELETSKKVKDVIDGYKQAGIEVKNVSESSLLKKILPTDAYESLQAGKARVKGAVGPSVWQLTDPIAQSAKRLMDDMSSRNALLFSRLATELNETVYTDRMGETHTFKELSGFFKGGTKKALREQLSEDLKSGSSDDIKRTAGVRKVLKKVWEASKKSGLDLAPFEKNYFPRVFKPEVLKLLYKDIDKLGNLDPRILSSDLIKKSGFEQSLEKAINSKDISQKTIDTLLEIQNKIATRRAESGQPEQASLAESFEVLRNNVLSERVVLNKSLEKKRVDSDLPDNLFETDAGVVLINYLARATKRIAYAETVGNNGEIMFNKINALNNKARVSSDKTLGRQSEIIKRAFDAFTGLIETDSDYNYSYRTKNFLNDFVNFQVATKIGLGFATIPNITQTFISSALRLGYSPFFKGTLKAIKDKEYREDIKKNSGAGTLELWQMVTGFQSGQSSKMGWLADKITRGSGFQGINRVNKLVSSYTALEAAKGWQKLAKSKPKTARQAALRSRAIRNLREMGVKDFNKKMTPKEMARVMYEFSRDAQLQKNVFLEPAFFNNPKVQPFILFKRFGYRQAEMMMRWGNQAVKDKDMAFFLRLGAAGFAGGAFVNWAKSVLSNLLAGEDVYDDNYKLNVDGTDYTMRDFIEGLGSVGAFGMVTDIISAESKRITVEFVLKPAIIQDSFKLYNALIRIGTDVSELGPNGVTLQRSAKYLSPILGTVPKRLARLAETPKQRADRRRAMLGITKKKIFDYMLEDNDIMVKRIIK